MLRKDVPMATWTDLMLHYDGIVGINLATEERLLIDLIILRELYELHKISNLVWIPSGDNSADALTRFSLTLALIRLMAENRISISAKFEVRRA